MHAARLPANALAGSRVDTSLLFRTSERHPHACVERAGSCRARVDEFCAAMSEVARGLVSSHLHRTTIPRPSPSSEICHRIGQGMSALGKTFDLPCATNGPYRSNPGFHPAPFSERRCHISIHCHRPEGGCRSSATGARELCPGPMRSRHLCPVGSGQGDHQIPQLHQAIPGAGALLGGRRQSRRGGH